MSAIYVYAMLPADAPAPPRGLAGLDGAPVSPWCPPLLTAHELQGWTSRFDAPVAPEPTLARVQAHDTVVAAALAQGVTPVPFRFGHWFASEEAALTALPDRLPGLAALAGTLRGTVEYRALLQREATGHAPAASPGLSASPGRQRLEAARLRQAAAAEREEWGGKIAEQLQERVAPFVLAEQLRTDLVHGRWRLTVSHLVARPNIDRYLVAVATWLGDEPSSSATIVGPSAPYSFAAE